jgi:hypothetical protein
MTIRTFVFMLSVCSLLPQGANGSDVRHTAFAEGLRGTWASSQNSCQRKDDSNFSISAAQFDGAEGKCEVLWIVERPARRGPTFGVHARCVDPKQPDNVRTVDLIFLQQDTDKIEIGKAFDALKTYQRCSPK